MFATATTDNNQSQTQMLGCGLVLCTQAGAPAQQQLLQDTTRLMACGAVLRDLQRPATDEKTTQLSCSQGLLQHHVTSLTTSGQHSTACDQKHTAGVRAARLACWLQGA